MKSGAFAVIKRVAPLLALIAGLLFIALSSNSAIASKRRFLAALFFPESVSFLDLQAKHQHHALRILVVPGHDEESWGTEFRGVKEAELTLAASHYLVRLLSKDPAFQVFTARTGGDYVPGLKDYFRTQEAEINAFKKEKQQLMKTASQAGFEQQDKPVYHATAKRSTVFKLYGINKWANDNAIDAVLHIHFNDYAGRRPDRVGEYAGMAIYVPDRQLPNAKASRQLAQAVFGQLGSILSTSNLPQESGGIIEDQDLIAIGVNASLDAASMVIEYGYIYETPLREAAIRNAFLEELAYQTYIGIKKGLDPDFKAEGLGSALLPHSWNRRMVSGLKADKDVLALQMALAKEGVYPPAGSDCPVSGNFFECTEAALKRFQEKYADEILKPFGLSKGTGIADRATLKKLNQLYGVL